MDIYYFAYGVNLNKDVLRKRIGDWKISKKAILEGYTLCFSVYSKSWKGGVADIREMEGSRVYGAVYLITEEQLNMLDRYEGVPNTYMRRKVKVITEDGVIDAITYVATNPKGYVKPSIEYLSNIIKGLRQHGYDENVIKEVKRIADGKY